MDKIIVCEDVVKSFGKGDEKRNVLDGVSVEINEGEFVSVMGPSGSGKSTLMFALSGMDGVDSGKVTFGSMELSLRVDNSILPKVTFPLSTPSIPLSANINVDFPEPEGPITEMNSPSLISTDTPSSTLRFSSLSPNDLTIFSPIRILFMSCYSFIFSDILICPASNVPKIVAISTAPTINIGEIR